MNSNNPKEEEVNPVQEQGVQEQLSEKEKVERFLASEDNRQNALRLADQIQQCVGKNWFSLNRLVKKTGETNMTAFQKLQLCKMFKLVETKMGNFRDGRENSKVPLFKITISNEDRIKALNQIIQYHRDQIEHFETEIKQLNS